MFLVGVFFVCVLFLFCVCVKFSARESYESIVGDYQIKVTCHSIVDKLRSPTFLTYTRKWLSKTYSFFCLCISWWVVNKNNSFLVKEFHLIRDLFNQCKEKLNHHFMVIRFPFQICNRKWNSCQKPTDAWLHGNRVQLFSDFSRHLYKFRINY